jgi:hypothetical protein
MTGHLYRVEFGDEAILLHQPEEQARQIARLAEDAFLPVGVFLELDWSSPFADPDADSKGYPHRRTLPCQRGTPSQFGCRISCAAPACVYLTHGNCPWSAWGKLTHTERDDYNKVPMAQRTHKQSGGK